MLIEVKKHLEFSNFKCKSLAGKKKTYSIGYLVMVCINKRRAPIGIYSKLQDRKLGHFKICHKARDNAHILKLPSNLHISATFNIVDIYQYYPPNDGISYLENSRVFSSKRGQLMQEIN